MALPSRLALRAPSHGKQSELRFEDNPLSSVHFALDVVLRRARLLGQQPHHRVPVTSGTAGTARRRELNDLADAKSVQLHESSGARGFLGERADKLPNIRNARSFLILLIRKSVLVVIGETGCGIPGGLRAQRSGPPLRHCSNHPPPILR